MNEEKPKKYNFSPLNLLILLVLSFLVGGMIMYGAMQSSFNDFFTQSNQSLAVVGEEAKIVDVIANSSPAVVSIVATAEVPQLESYYFDPYSELPPEFREFFDLPEQPQSEQNGTERVRVGAGKGFLVSADGYIVTNKHVVEDESAEYAVFLNDEQNKGETVTATVLARDPNTDLAILKIDKDNMPFLEFGDSDSLQVGQTAITIGYALGEFDNSVSKGVVSGLSRSIVAGTTYGAGAERLKNLIQTDAAINPGNSGGPMLNIEGKVIGVNVAMASAENIGFAIPGNLAKNAFEEVKLTGTIKKQEIAFLGVRYLLINENVQSRNNLPYDYGALVVRGDTPEDLAIIPGSPADLAGIVENDIILAVDSLKINERNHLADLITKHKPGDEITLKVYHKGEEKDLTVKLGKN